MPAERSTETNRSVVGSWCATALVCLCLAQTFAGCLNPLTDDQPSRREAVVEDGSRDPGDTPGSTNSSGAGGNDLIDDEDVQGGGVSANPQNPSPGESAPPDAGVPLDAGADSGSSGAP